MDYSKLKFLTVIPIVLISCIILFSIASTDNDRECIKYALPTPTPTPIPLSHIYSEWIPMPGTSPDTGHGWVKATEFMNIQRVWPPKQYLTAHILTDTEYNYIAETYGLRMTRGSKWGYGFPPRQGFPLLYGGVVLKNEWLPTRLK